MSDQKFETMRRNLHAYNYGLRSATASNIYYVTTPRNKVFIIRWQNNEWICEAIGSIDLDNQAELILDIALGRRKKADEL